MALIKAPAANTLTLATGLEVVNNAIRLQVGAGGWDANSLEMGALPTAPWVDTQGGGVIPTASVIEGRYVRITDNNTGPGSTRTYNLAWGESLAAGVTLYIKMRGPSANPYDSATVILGDASNFYQIRQRNDALLELLAGTNPTNEVIKYPWNEIFITINANSLTYWIWNPVTEIWDVLQTGIASFAAASNFLAFGAGGSSSTGDGLWDFIRFKTAIEATPFRTTGLVAEWASALTVGANIDQIDLAETVSSGANIRHQYDIGSGYNGSWLTLAALQSALVDTSPATLRLKHQFNSDGLAQALLDFDGTQSVVGSEAAAGNGGTRSRFAKPLGVKGRLAA